MGVKFSKEKLVWMNEPKEHTIEEDKITIVTEPDTDYWQRTYYGFQSDNAPSLVMSTEETYFSYVVKATFDSKNSFDQCGVLVYIDSDNWIKISVEYENEKLQKLGSVVTNHGYSDWATRDISADQKFMYYRVSRRESDYCIENSFDGVNYEQMRITHLFEGAGEIKIGLYACSPGESSFAAEFTGMELQECQWELE